MKTLQKYAEKANNDNSGFNPKDDFVSRVSSSTSLAKTRIELLNKIIYLQDICSEVGLPLSRVPADAERSVRENIRRILEQMSLVRSGSYVPALVATVEEATRDLLYVDECIMRDRREAGTGYDMQASPADELRNAAIEMLGSGLNYQAVFWNREDVEELRQMRIALCRFHKDGLQAQQSSYNESMGLEVIGEDKHGRQLVVVVHEPEKVEKRLTLAKPSNGQG